MPAPYMSEVAKVRDMDIMKYIIDPIADVGCGPDKVTPAAVGFDGRQLDGVNIIGTGNDLKFLGMNFQTIFSSHFLEHTPDPYSYIATWSNYLYKGGHLVLYLPEKSFYNSLENPEHLFNWSYEEFMFFFRRCFCGDGKNFKGEHLPKLFEVVESGLDIGDDRYSFYVIAQKV